jgi:hypothetical protein
MSYEFFVNEGIRYVNEIDAELGRRTWGATAGRGGAKGRGDAKGRRWMRKDVVEYEVVTGGIEHNHCNFSNVVDELTDMRKAQVGRCLS